MTKTLVVDDRDPEQRELRAGFLNDIWALSVRVESVAFLLTTDHKILPSCFQVSGQHDAKTAETVIVQLEGEYLQ